MIIELKIDISGNKWWMQDSRFHREMDQPSIIMKSGDKGWYENGYFHREFGPAIIYKDDLEEWYIKGKFIRRSHDQD